MYNFKITDEPFARGYLGVDSESRFVRTGNGYLEAAKTMRLVIEENVGLAWFGTGDMASFTSLPDGQSINIGMLEGKAERNPELADDYRYIIENMKDRNINDRIRASFTENESDSCASHTGDGGLWGGHSVPDIIDFAKLGTDGMRKKVNYYKALNSDVADFYDGMLLVLDAIDILGERVYAGAKERYEKAENDKQKRKLRRLMDTFDHCPKAPANTFAEAITVYVMIVYLDGVDSPGHFDWYMIDFWEKSDYAESREALEDLWQFFHWTRTWNLCISGSDENWNDKTNALSYEILDVCAKYKYNTPNLTMRCHRNTPEKLLRAAAKAIGAGTGMPTFYNDEIVCPALERLGISPHDAHEYIMNGCNQIDIQGKSHMGLEDGTVNLGMAVEFAIFNGVCQKQKKRIGVCTGDVSELDTFEKFYDAVKIQVKYIIDAVCNMANKSQRIYAKYTANPIKSMTIKGCLEKGLDVKAGGPIYGHGQILAQGVPDSIDSIANIKKFVYEDKKYTLAEVRDALAADFEGYEEMYSTFKNSELKFGNDIDYVDEIAKDLIDYYNAYLLTKPTVRGGFYSGGCSPFEEVANHGRAVGALPNGKKYDEYLFGDCIGATPGCDVNGPTALLSSCLKFDHSLPASGFILNLRFDKALFNTEKGIDAFLSLHRAYFENKGQNLSVTVLDRAELEDAVEHPENHRNLIVRVGGFSAYFVDLGRDIQENILARTDYSI